MLSQLIVSTDRSIRKEHRDSRIDQLRAAIVTTAKADRSITEDEKRWIDFRPPPPYHMLPKILYGQPSMKEKSFTIYGYGQDGREILKKMGEALKKKGSIDLNGEHYQIGEYSLNDGLPYLPVKSFSQKHYYTASPVILFDKKRDHIEWYAISKKFQKDDPAEYDRQMKKAIGNLIRANILRQLKDRVSEKDYPFVNEIEINIKDFRFFTAKYHKDQPKTPMLFMTFSSNYELPMFIGHHTGKGYGSIMKDKRAGGIHG